MGLKTDSTLNWYLHEGPKNDNNNDNGGDVSDRDDNDEDNDDDYDDDTICVLFLF